jgi:hypothetical protein
VSLLATVARNRDLALVGVAWAAASLGNWAFSILLAIYAYREGGTDAVALAVVVRMLPSAVAAPYAAMLADRHSRREILLWSALGRAAMLAVAAAAAAAGAPLGIVLLAAAAFTMVNTAHRPAQAAIMPQLARTPAELAAANVGWSAIDYAGFLLGGAAAGTLTAVAGLDTAFMACAAAFAVVAAAVVPLPRDARPQPLADTTTRVAEVAEGARAVLADVQIRLLVGIYTVNAVVQGMIDVLLVVAAIELFALGESGVGWLNAAWGVGGLLGGGASLALLTRGRLASGLASGLALAGLAFAATGTLAEAPAAFPLLAAMGVGFALVQAALLTLTQRLAADDVLARVFGVEETLEVLALGLGSVLAAGLVAVFDVRVAIIVAGAVLPVTALVAAARLSKTEAAAPVPERAFRLVRAIPMFQSLPVATIENLALRAEEHTYAPGQAIVVQGEIGDAFHVIADGEVEVVADGARLCRRGGGDFFGEIALLRDAPRMATVSATQPVTTLMIEREHFLGAISGHARSTGTADAIVRDRLEDEPELVR